MRKLPLIQIVWALGIAVLAFSLFSQGPAGPQPIPYSQFQTALDQGRVAKVTIVGDEIRGEYKEKQPDGATAFTTQRGPTDIAPHRAKQGWESSGAPSSSALGTLLSWVLPPILFVGIWILASR